MPSRTQGDGGYVKLYRSLADWEWFKDVKTAHLWMYILLRANYEPSTFMGIKIRRGELLESQQSMAEATGLSRQSVRTALKHLKSTGEITYRVTRYGTHIKVHNYALYQDVPGRS